MVRSCALSTPTPRGLNRLSSSYLSRTDCRFRSAYTATLFLPCFSIVEIFERHRRTRDRYDSNHGRLFSSLSFSFSQSFLASRLFNPSFSFILLTPFLSRSVSLHRSRSLISLSVPRKQSLSSKAARSPGRDMNSRSSFYIPRSPALHFACSSPLSASPICDYRMCRLHGYLTGFSSIFLLSRLPPSPPLSHSPSIFSRYIRE